MNSAMPNAGERAAAPVTPSVAERSPGLLRVLVDLRDMQIQKARIQFGQRVSALGRESDTGNEFTESMMLRYEAMFNGIERELNRDIAVQVALFPIYQHACQVKGVGPMLAAKIIARVGSIDSFNTVSKLWRYAGYATVIDPNQQFPDGLGPADFQSTSASPALRDTPDETASHERFDTHAHEAFHERMAMEWQPKRVAERRVKGEKLHYNFHLKNTLFLVATSFLRSGSPYRRVYDEAREKYERTRPDWTPMHKHRAALRVMIKVFLTHFWRRWRMIEGLDVPPLYVHAKLGHTMDYRDTDFGWPSL